MKKNSGFSLVELLVVVAIIGVLSGVGIVGFQRYVESAKQKVALQNFDTVIKFFSTELILLNNNIQTESALIKVSNVKWKRGVHNLNSFLEGAAKYHDLGYGLASFRNPYQNQSIKQVYSTSIPDDANSSNLTKKGNIVLRVHPDHATDGAKIAGDRQFQVLYYVDDGVIDTTNTKSLTLK
ncbi:prepilin-type N-terminal cleavage/methylation domain-containing protein [Pelagibacteraceae bacterium]|jgi:prepilin-type N-terminal cleavage/methylation domain-containing protein|nr:prepilin-type N-terminal cleavage/methylation domain-containing protein [Pelagibacteraceae bacterium]